ncbi:winged helix-turn-helix domain-containing protein [Bradyrhizobium sp. CB1650]|uniref:winged helix-turn-helix domain-containing protein n=1 Tax=Bradyrhizobium sp. CB1650 TaxID=3039153 RepID=UPI002434A16F|nr:winged helix-turn-helix domain-containing protein [Bradyrhizobium sp. CB1650]WGD51015.1 winged helix-turn-helix domain-containing protein [Bradyrhizobium sp. CB1650]
MRPIDRKKKPETTGIASSHDKLVFLDLVLDVRAQRVSRNGRPIKVRPLEFRLLQHFLEHPEQVFSRTELLSIIWGQNLHVGSRSVDLQISRLRKALNEGGQRNYIRTVHSRGYSLDAQE